jgi:hypothetical protein
MEMYVVKHGRLLRVLQDMRCFEEKLMLGEDRDMMMGQRISLNENKIRCC